MELRNAAKNNYDNDFTDLLAEDINEHYDTSPIPPSPGSGYSEGNIAADEDDADLIADEQLDSFIIDNQIDEILENGCEYKATFNNFKVNIQCLR